MSKTEGGMLAVGITGLIFTGIQAWDILDKRGLVMSSLVPVGAWFIGFGLLVWAVVYNLRTARRSEVAIITTRETHKGQLNSLQEQITLLKAEAGNVSIAASELNISKATWGNEFTRVPVADILNHKRRNSLTFYVYHEAFPDCGPDPAPGIDKKYVEIEYSYPGREPLCTYSKRFQGEWVFLP